VKTSESYNAYLLIEPEDRVRMIRLAPVAAGHVDEIVDVFYEHLLAFSETTAVLKQVNLVRLRGHQRAHFLEMFEGQFDEKHVKGRRHIGQVHERVGLAPRWYMGAYARFVNLLVPYILEEFADPAEGLAHVQSFTKVLFLDMSLAIETYIEAQQATEAKLRGRFSDELGTFSGGLSEATGRIVESSAQLAAAATEQAAVVTEVSATVAQVRQVAAHTVVQANSVIESADHSVASSRAGLGAVAQTVEGMHAIQGEVQSIAGRILTLSEQTEEIGEIITSVREIADQSKLLALNAAIEAARAGEHGRGFTVVAREIRSLADQSRAATEQVSRLLREIQKATHSAVLATEEGSRSVARGVELAQRAGNNIEQLTEAIGQAADAARLIRTSAQQQSNGVEEVTSAMNGINSAATNTADGAHAAEVTAQGLMDMADRMAALVFEFTQGRVER
jgi:methyl-accepting chemotaxis protein